MRATGDDVLAPGLLGRPGAGDFSVAIGPGWRHKLLARRWGHRRSGCVPVRLAITPTMAGQRWIRTIDGRDITSTIVRDPGGGALVEQFGALSLVFQPTVYRDRVLLELLDAKVVLGPVTVPLPRWALPTVTVRTRRVEDSLLVRVEVRNRRGHRILTYEGVLS